MPRRKRDPDFGRYEVGDACGYCAASTLEDALVLARYTQALSPGCRIAISDRRAMPGPMWDADGNVVSEHYAKRHMTWPD